MSTIFTYECTQCNHNILFGAPTNKITYDVPIAYDCSDCGHRRSALLVKTEHYPPFDAPVEKGAVHDFVKPKL